MDNWNTLQKELSLFGIDLVDNRFCKVNNKTMPIRNVLALYKRKLKENQKIISYVCNETLNLINITDYNVCDEKSTKLFIQSIKNIFDLIDCFENLDNSKIKRSIESALNRDVYLFSQDAILLVPCYKIAMDWTFREIHQNEMINKMLFLSILGKDRVNKIQSIKKANNNINIKAAYGQGTISGPWANLDLPFGERMWSYGQDEDNLRGAEKSKTHQRRYRKGLINYNGIQDPEEGAFWIWYEPKNEPFGWDSRKEDSPYPSREHLYN